MDLGKAGGLYSRVPLKGRVDFLIGLLHVPVNIPLSPNSLGSQSMENTSRIRLCFPDPSSEIVDVKTA